MSQFNLKVCIDIEADALKNPKHIWLIVCKDIETEELYIFRNLTEENGDAEKFKEFARKVVLWIGHNILDYDLRVISRLLNLHVGTEWTLDTLILSRLIDYSRAGHSIEDYGLEFGLEKISFTDFSKWSQELETYCIRDVHICHKIYLKYLKYLSNDKRKSSIRLEHKFQILVNSLEDNGFGFNTSKAKVLLNKVEEELKTLDKEILKSFPDKVKFLKEVTPRLTQHGTLNKSDFRFEKSGDLSIYNGGPFSRISYVPFNPSSHKQLIEVLNEAGWSPTDKTQTHVDTERELNQLRRRKERDEALDIELKSLYDKQDQLRKSGWKINETNLSTLPSEAPSSARTLAKRILIESRRRTLTEWLGLVDPDTNRIYGRFQGIGAWTHRMSHQNPNTANIPREFQEDGSPKLLGKEMRQLWQAPRNRLLVGVDAEGIQLRIFAHYINDPEFTDALVKGKKDDKTDPHSLNQRILGSVCKTRQAAKRFIYALLLGGGIGKLSQILGCGEPETKEALARLIERYQGFAYLREKVIPADARRGWFEGLDGRAVRIPGLEVGERKHLCMSGYLQNGEAVVMKMAALKWHEQLLEEGFERWLFINMVHDEWQTEVKNNMKEAIRIAEIQADSLRLVGEELKLHCPLAGSYWNDDHKDYTIGTNWYQTH